MTAGILEASAAQPRPPGQPSNPPASTSGSPHASPAALPAASVAALGDMLGTGHAGSAQGLSEWGRAMGPRQLSLYAGVGVVAGSQPHAEWQVRHTACRCDQVQGVVSGLSRLMQHAHARLAALVRGCGLLSRGECGVHKFAERQNLAGGATQAPGADCVRFWPWCCGWPLPAP